MRRKLTTTLLLSCFLMLCFSQAVFGGWREQRQWKYENEDGSYKEDEWFTDQAGKTYYVNKEGIMTVGWYADEEGAKYFFDSKGVMVRGLTEIGAMAFYFQEDGRLFEGDMTIEGHLFHFSREGTPLPGEFAGFTPSYTSAGLPLRESGEYDNRNPGHYLPFVLLFFIAVWMGWMGRRKKEGCEMMFVFAAVLLSSTPVFTRYLNYGHDLTFHLNRLLGIKESLKAGMFPVRINGFTFNGYGYPDPVFYPQLFLYIPAVLHILGAPFTASVHTFLLLCNWAGAMTMYLCGKRLFGKPSIACMSSMIYAMGVYRLCNAYTRAAYGELLAMIFFPLVIWGLYELFYGQERYWIVLPIAFTGIFQSHLISTVLIAGACVVFGIAGIRQLKEKKRLLAFGKVMGLTLCLNLWTLVPLLQYMSAGMDTSSLQFAAESNAAPWPVLLEIFPEAEGSSPNLVEDLSSVMPLSLGLVLIAGTLLVLALCLFTEEKAPKAVRVLLWTGIGLTVAASDLFPWRLLVRIPVMKTAASYIQFPWRFLAIATCCLPLAAAYGAERVWNKINRGLLYTGVLLAAMVSTQYYIDQINGTQARVWTEHNVTSAIGKTEYLYPETPIDNLQGQVYISEDQVTVENLERGKLSLRLSYENTGRAQEACIDVPLFYFPGYRGEDGNGAPLTVERGEGNLVRVNVSGRSGQVHVFFREPFLWRVTELISLAAAVLAIWEIRSIRRDSTDGKGI